MGRKYISEWVRKVDSGSESGSDRQRVGQKVGKKGREWDREWVRQAEIGSESGSDVQSRSDNGFFWTESESETGSDRQRVGQKVGQIGRVWFIEWVRQAESWSESGSDGPREGQRGREWVREWITQDESGSESGSDREQRVGQTGREWV